MPDGYSLHDGLFVQERASTSGAGATGVSMGLNVPAGKVYTILSAELHPSVNETQTYYFAIVTRNSNVYPVTIPTSVALTSTLPYPMLTEGTEIKMFPGEHLSGYRVAATAGSTLSMNVRWIETDLPPYEYIEPQERKRIAAFKRAIVPDPIKSFGGRGSGFGGGAGSASGGGGGGPRPK